MHGNVERPEREKEREGVAGEAKYGTKTFRYLGELIQCNGRVSLQTNAGQVQYTDDNVQPQNQTLKVSSES